MNNPDHYTLIENHPQRCCIGVVAWQAKASTVIILACAEIRIYPAQDRCEGVVNVSLPESGTMRCHLLAAAFMVAAIGVRSAQTPPPQRAPAQEPQPLSQPQIAARYVGSRACQSCHTQIYRRWQKTPMANVVHNPREYPDAILPDLDTNTVKKFTREDVGLVYGSIWKQRYFTKIGDDYFPQPSQWDIMNHVWRAYFVPNDADWWAPLYPPDNMKRPTSTLCDGCHSVNFNIRDHSITEWNVRCERCHGPGSEHVARPSRANIQNPARMNYVDATDTCIQCHSQGRPLTNPIEGKYYDWPVGFHVGLNLQDYWQLEEHKIGETSFTHFPDGTAHKNRMQGNDFVQSVMYRRGVTCFSCHDVHGTANYAELRLPPNQICFTCHGPGMPNGPRTGTLEEHTHHRADVLFTTATGLLEWNPVTNTIAQITLPPTFQVGGMAASADGTKVIVFSDVEPGAVVMYDSGSDTIAAQRNYPGFVFGVQANPAGTLFTVLDDTGGLQVYDAQLNVLGLIPPGVFDTGVLYSQDGNSIYVVADSGGVPAIFTVNTNNLQLVGIAPAYATIPPHAELSPPYIIETPFGVDSTGLIFGAADHGIAVDDSTYFQTIFPPANTPIFDKLVEPDAGPINVATTVQVLTSSFDAIPDAWFGSQRAATEDLLNGGGLQITAPPSIQAGPVNLKLIQPNGVQIFDPLAYSYGRAPLFLSGDAGSPEGGETVDIIAVGIPNDPSKIQVSVGGSAASVATATIFQSAFPAVDIKAALPAGIPGAADLTVTTSAGSMVMPKAFHFLQSGVDYSSTDTLQSIFYDRFRNQLYLSAGDHVDVFSLASKQFLAPFALPSSGGKKQFAGMALTPDGSKLIVTNLIDGSVDLLNPDNPSSVTSVPIAPGFPGPDGLPCFIGPAYAATTNTGKAFIVYGGVSGINCGPGGPVYELDLSTLSVSTPPVGCPQEDSFVSSSRDGSKVAFGGGPWSIFDSASSTCAYKTFFQPYGAAASGDRNIFAAGFRLTDSMSNLLNIMAFPDPYYPAQLPGTPQGNGEVPLIEEKMNDTGSLLYVPFANSVDILDVNHAVLQRRVSLSEQIPSVIDALAIDTTGQSIFLITNKGLTIVELDAVPLSIGNIAPITASPETQIRVRGSCFAVGTTATINGTSAALTFTDENTLQLTVPTVPSGAAQIQVSNPDGSTYSLEDAFTIP